jgi:CRISPR system Cascade subunit CasA
MPHSLLDDPLFRICGVDDTVESQTLPQILDRLADEGAPPIVSFEAIQPHQQQPWHSFLVQLAAIAVARGTSNRPGSPDAWRAALLNLAGGTEAAWHLVVEDLAQPAFLQSPVPERALEDAGFKADNRTPDLLDVLVTSKNHDVKMERIADPRLEHWIYALIALQTTVGGLGRGNYQIIRMNGFYGNRPMMGLTPDLSWDARFRRDLRVLLDARAETAERYEYDPNGIALLWTERWDGAKDSALPLQDLDPYFIEVCRRIRFTQSDDGALTCWRANSKGQRVDAPDDLNGITGDPWTPIDKSGGKALTLGGSGFTYQKLHRIFLSGDYQKPPALHPAGDDGMLYLVARTLVRGQGKTEGLHHRVVPVPARVARLFGSQSDLEQLASRARGRIEKASEVERRVLYPSIGTLIGGGSTDAIDGEDIAPWLDAFDRAVDAAFFPKLWDTVEQEMSGDEAEADWHRFLCEEATRQFEDAETRTPRTATRYWRARSSAQSIFHGALRHVVPAAFDDAPQATAPPAY